MSQSSEKAAKPEEPPRGRFKSELFEWGEALLTSLTVVILLFVFLARVIGVSGSSMVPTLQDKDQLLVSNLFYRPEKGDIVILTKNSFAPVPIVKRVIATEGDTIDIDFDEGTVTVNGEVLDEPYIAEETHRMFDMEFPQTVPEGSIFVMGDNRNDSVDSRYSAIGMVDTRYILGKAYVRALPFTKFGFVS